MLDVAIIGAGPYGLSLASHLRAQNVNFRIFGKPMLAWTEHMPPGMILKSDGNSLDFCDPNAGLTIQKFHVDRGQSFRGEQVISRETFISYGLDFQSHVAASSQPEDVVSVELDNSEYILQLSNHEMVRAKQVVLAIGVYFFRYIPPVLTSLPAEYCTHSAEYGSVEQFRGKKVAVVGAGASAIDLAVALGDHGAEPVIVSRRLNLRFQTPPQPPRKGRRTVRSIMRSIYGRLWKPSCGIGSGWPLKLYAEAPNVFHMFPAALRNYILRTTLGPASTWVTKDLLMKQGTPILAGKAPRAARIENGKVKLTLESRDGSISEIEVDHVIGATGYRVDVRNIPFLTESVRKKIRTYEDAPILSQKFETTCPGLYFVGPATAMSFGPVMRFVFGVGFTTRTIMKRLVRSSATATAPQSNAVLETNG